MHRFFVAVIAVLLLGCSSAESAVGGDASELRIVVWQYHLVGQQEYYRELAQAFERANPGHRVVIRLESWNTAHDKIRHWVSAGEGPDLTIVPDVWLAEFASGLDPYADSLPAAFLARGFTATRWAWCGEPLLRRCFIERTFLPVRASSLPLTGRSCWSRLKNSINSRVSMG